MIFRRRDAMGHEDNRKSFVACGGFVAKVSIFSASLYSSRPG
jgi:hypothetical protein